MSRPTFLVEEDLVRITLRGVPHPEGFPHLPDDQGLVKQLLIEMVEGRLPIEMHWEVKGGGTMIASWRKADALKIIAWLRQRADEDEEGGAR